jgi:hypothetical protein
MSELAEREGLPAANRTKAKPLILSIDPNFSQFDWPRFAAL